MKEEIYLYFIGTAGSGKSTLTSTFKQWMTNQGLDAITVNLDPGAENLPYSPDVDIRDWISLKEVMKEYGLGPNGAQIACADMLALNTSDVKESIESFKTEYILMDTPGQLELFVFREAGKYIIEFLKPARSMIAYLLDPNLSKTASGFVSQMLLALNTSFRMEKPQVNILSKSDMLSQEELDLIFKWSEDPDILEESMLCEKASVHQEMSRGILNLIKEFQDQLKVYPTEKEEFQGIPDIYTMVQLEFKGGEDLLSD
jgi:GTPase SAR1 family protein